jgi:chemotaxis response regulator CheB
MLKKGAPMRHLFGAVALSLPCRSREKIMFSVLVIDDSLTVRAIIEQLLEGEKDLRVVGSADSVAAAREMIEKFVPSVIILDLAMPGIDGFAFLDELAGHPHAPVLVVSSHTTGGSTAETEAIDRGAKACFDKAQLVRNGKSFVALVREAVSNKAALDQA